MKKSDVILKFEMEQSNAMMCLSRGQYAEAKASLLTACAILKKLVEQTAGDESRYFEIYLFNIERQIKFLDEKLNGKSPDKTINVVDRGQHKQVADNVDINVVSPRMLKYTFDDVAGLDHVKQVVKDKVVNPYYYPGLYKMFKKSAGGGILLYGLPGTGKTMIAQAIAKETNATFFPVKTSDIISKWFGESSKNISRIFDEARKCSNAVIFFDEIEVFTLQRDNADSDAVGRLVCELLAQMDGVQMANNNQGRLLVVGATNKPWKIDSAFLRPGRFDEQIYVPLPDEEARKNIIINNICCVPGHENIDIDKLVAYTFNFNGADVKYLCEKAKEFAIRRIIANHMKDRVFMQQDFDNACLEVKSSVVLSDVNKMDLWQRDGEYADFLSTHSAQKQPMAERICA